MGDGLEGNFWEEGLPLCVQSKFECLRGCSGHNFLWQLVPVRDYSKPNAGGGSEDCVTWKVEEAVHYFLHANKVTTDSSTDKGKKLQPLEGCLVWDVAQPLYTLHRELLNTF